MKRASSQQAGAKGSNQQWRKLDGIYRYKEQAGSDVRGAKTCVALATKWASAQKHRSADGRYERSNDKSKSRRG